MWSEYRAIGHNHLVPRSRFHLKPLNESERSLKREAKVSQANGTVIRAAETVGQTRT